MGTFSDNTYSRENFMNLVINKDNTKTLNIFDPKLIKLIKQIKVYRTDVYVSGTRLTTLSYRYYGTTSLSWLILTYNGFSHELSIPTGSEIRIPSLSDIQQIKNQITQPSNIGQIIRI